MKYLFSIAVLVVLAASPAFGEFYEYKDKDGNTVITESPPAGAESRKKLIEDERIWRSTHGEKDYSAPERRDASNPRREELRKKDYSSVTVKMYMTDWCGYCKKAREYIRSFGAELVEYDVDKDKSKRDEMRQKISGSGVPVIDIEGTIIRGYDTEAIKAALDQYAR